MTLTKETAVDLIEVVGTSIHVRQATVIAENDIELAKTYHRHVLQPGDDLTGQDERVAAVATAIWTPESVAAWSAEFIAFQAAERQRRLDAVAAVQAAEAELRAAQERLAAAQAA